MDQDQQEHKTFLEEQLEWCKEQDRILEEIDTKLHEMKKIAEYALERELTLEEIDESNNRLNGLKNEVHFLESQLHSVVH